MTAYVFAAHVLAYKKSQVTVTNNKDYVPASEYTRIMQGHVDNNSVIQQINGLKLTYSHPPMELTTENIAIEFPNSSRASTPSYLRRRPVCTFTYNKDQNTRSEVSIAFTCDIVDWACEHFFHTPRALSPHNAVSEFFGNMTDVGSLFKIGSSSGSSSDEEGSGLMAGGGFLGFGAKKEVFHEDARKALASLVITLNYNALLCGYGGDAAYINHLTQNHSRDVAEGLLKESVGRKEAVDVYKGASLSKFRPDDLFRILVREVAVDFGLLNNRHGNETINEDDTRFVIKDAKLMRYLGRDMAHVAGDDCEEVFAKLRWRILFHVVAHLTDGNTVDVNQVMHYYFTARALIMAMSPNKTEKQLLELTMTDENYIKKLQLTTLKGYNEDEMLFFAEVAGVTLRHTDGVNRASASQSQRQVEHEVWSMWQRRDGEAPTPKGDDNGGQ